MAIYILYYNFPSTAGNHAGMSYLAHKLKAQFPDVKLIKHAPQEIKGAKYWLKIQQALIFCYLFVVLKPGDKVFFMEYLTYGVAFQDRLARWLKKAGKQSKLIGLVHLAGSHLLELYGDEQLIRQKLSWLDKVVVFGSSLSAFIKACGFNKEVSVCHHYVDVDFYRPTSGAPNQDSSLHVIVVGRLKRNFDQLHQLIARSSNDIVFHLCTGGQALQGLTDSRAKVISYGFLQEEALLALMQRCDVHLAVLEDTVGSNAITSAMAVGLVQVVSDVGSIRDYCDAQNSMLCKNLDDFTEALSFLSKNPARVQSMKSSARRQAESMSLANFYKSFPDLL